MLFQVKVYKAISVWPFVRGKAGNTIQLCNLWWCWGLLSLLGRNIIEWQGKLQLSEHNSNMWRRTIGLTWIIGSSNGMQANCVLPKMLAMFIHSWIVCWRFDKFLWTEINQTWIWCNQEKCCNKIFVQHNYTTINAADRCVEYCYF